MKKEIATNKAPAAVGPYSQAIEVKGTLYCSGQIPFVPETGEVVKGGIVEQTKQSFANVKAVLEEAKMTLPNVVKTTVYLAHIEDFAAMNQVYASMFEKPYPARSAFAVKDLPKGVLVEIEVIAVK